MATPGMESRGGSFFFFLLQPLLSLFFFLKFLGGFRGGSHGIASGRGGSRPPRPTAGSATASSHNTRVSSLCSSSTYVSVGPADRAMAPAAACSHGEHSTEVVFVRHGETALNVSHIIQGRIDQELNETGRKQADKVALLLSQQAKPAAIYSSDMKRADQTAQSIATATGSDLVIDPKLTEMHMGLFQGCNKDDVKRSEAFKAVIRNRDQEIPGGGESLNQVSERCVSCLNAIAKKHKGERVVVVSHEVVIREICRHADPTSSDSRKFPNTSISVVHISGFDGRWILEKFGDVSHLTGDGDGFPRGTSSLWRRWRLCITVYLLRGK